MALRLGTDLCNTKRIAAIYKKFGAKFLDRILTVREKEYVLSSKKLFLYRLSGRFAAKEAVSKALGTGIGEKLSFLDIEILRVDSEDNIVEAGSDKSAAPKIFLGAAAQKISDELGLTEWALSVSHEDDFVIAQVVAI